MARYVIANRRATKFTAGLLFLLFLESGIKLEELFALKASHFDFLINTVRRYILSTSGRRRKIQEIEVANGSGSG